jgi:hypothetical protein
MYSLAKARLVAVELSSLTPPPFAGRKRAQTRVASKVLDRDDHHPGNRCALVVSMTMKIMGQKEHAMLDAWLCCL